MEAVSWTFQPYPGGTGALLEKTYREKGVAAFTRQPFAWSAGTAGAFNIQPWGSTPFPSSDEDIAFLPAHRLAAAIKAGKLTSTRITKIYLERLKTTESHALLRRDDPAKTARSPTRPRWTPRSRPASIAGRCTAFRGA